jgi:Ser-tRNA(Ala) deacylase AlaX
MKRAFVTLITLLLLLIPTFLIAEQEKKTDVEKPKTKYEVSQKLYKEYNITPPSYYVPPADSYVEMDQKALDEFERLMRDAMERNKKVNIENEKKIKAIEALDGVKRITGPVPDIVTVKVLDDGSWVIVSIEETEPIPRPETDKIE